MKNKFSLIVPVYNVEKYLEKCLNSIINQTYKDFEVIIVIDGSKDNSESICKKYAENDNRIKIIKQKNKGLSEARNEGIKKATGDYLLFIDSDDFIELNLLETLNNALEKDIDLIRFQANNIIDEKIIPYNETPFETTNGLDAFNKIRKYHYVEPVWVYLYNKKFWDKHNFKYVKDCVAEDYGLIPYVIACAKTVKSINYIGYNYITRVGSLMTSKDYSKKIKRIEDMIFQRNNLKEKLSTINNSENILAFLNDALIYHITTLNKKDYKKYNKKLKELNCYDLLKTDTLKHKIKKMILVHNSWFFYHYLVRFL